MKTNFQMRVYRIPLNLKARFKAKRIEADTTNQAQVAQAVTDQLPALIEILTAYGIEHDGDTSPVRWPMEDTILAQLRHGAAQTGVPASTLLIACLRMALGPGEPAAAVPEKAGKAKAGAAKPKAPAKPRKAISKATGAKRTAKAATRKAKTK